MDFFNKAGVSESGGVNDPLQQVHEICTMCHKKKIINVSRPGILTRFDRAINTFMFGSSSSSFGESSSPLGASSSPFGESSSLPPFGESSSPSPFGESSSPSPFGISVRGIICTECDSRSKKLLKTKFVRNPATLDSVRVQLEY